MSGGKVLFYGAQRGDGSWAHLGTLKVTKAAIRTDPGARLVPFRKEDALPELSGEDLAMLKLWLHAHNLPARGYEQIDTLIRRLMALLESQ
jgi:hypothetical protein